MDLLKVEKQKDKNTAEMEEVARILKKPPADRSQKDLELIVPYARNIKLFNDRFQDVGMSEETIRIIAK